MHVYMCAYVLANTVALTSIACLFHHRSFLDLGLPLWVGGVPFSPGPAYPFTSRGITACVGEVRVNGELLDLENYVYEQRSQRSCPQASVQLGCVFE